MSEDNDKGDMKSGFEGKTARNAPSMTEEQRERTGREVVEALQKLREEAIKNGLTPEKATEILDEYYAEKHPITPKPSSKGSADNA